MSPQLLWTIAGLILTVLTLGGVTISSYQSLDASTAKLIASETANIATAARLWSVNDSSDNTYAGITPATITKYIPDLAIASSQFTSRAASGVTYSLAQGSTPSQVVITATGISAIQTPLVAAGLGSKSCVVATVSTTSISYTCNS